MNLKKIAFMLSLMEKEMLPPENGSLLKKHLIEHSSQGPIPILEPLETSLAV